MKKLKSIELCEVCQSKLMQNTKHMGGKSEFHSELGLLASLWMRIISRILIQACCPTKGVLRLSDRVRNLKAFFPEIYQIRVTVPSASV